MIAHQTNFYPPQKQPSMYSLYQRRAESRPEPQHDRSNSFTPSSSNDLNPSSSYRQDGPRYPPFESHPPPPAFTSETASSHMNQMTTPSPVNFDPQQQAYAQYSLPVDHGINPDGSIDWNKATAAAQLQAALHAQQAQLAYLRQQRQQQDHWRELLAATTGGHGSGFGGQGAGGNGAMMGNAVQRFNELVAAGHDPMSMSSGFQWPTSQNGSGGVNGGGPTSGLGLSTHPGDEVMSSNPDWFSETAAMRTTGIPLSTHPMDGVDGDTRSPNGSRPATPMSRQPSLSGGVGGGYGEMGENNGGSAKRARQEDEGYPPKRTRLDSTSGMPSSDASG